VSSLRFERLELHVPRPFGRARPLRYDEIAEVAAENGTLVMRLGGGETVRVAGAGTDAERLRRLLAGPRAEGGIEELRRAAKDLFAEGAPLVTPAAADFLLGAAAALRASDLHLSPKPVTHTQFFRPGLEQRLGSEPPDRSAMPADVQDLDEKIGCVSPVLARVRVDGVLHDLCELPADAAVRVVARLKVLAGVASYRTDVPQHGRFRRGFAGDVAVDIRCAFVPVAGGERCVARLLGEGRALLDPGELGFDVDTLSLLRGLLQRPHGLVLVCGASGSGKTTTMYAALRELRRARAGLSSLVSIEDPVERRLEGVDQVELEPGRAPDAAEVLSALLRQDADVICLGEVRDPRAAEVMLEAAFTGHLVIAGLHCGSAAEAHARLLDLGADARLLGSALAGVLHQRLLRRACARCAAAGCEACLRTGYQGRFAVGEGYEASPALRARVAARAPADEIAMALAKEGFVPARRRAEARAGAGETTAAEVERAFGPGGGAP
jgi:hypothetical protein